MLKEVIMTKNNVVEKILFTDMEPFGNIEGSCMNEEGDERVSIRDAARLLPKEIEFRNENIAYIDIDYICSNGWTLNQDTLDLMADECSVNEKYADYLMELIKVPEDETEKEIKSHYIDIMYDTIMTVYNLSIKFLEHLKEILDNATFPYEPGSEETTEAEEKESEEEDSNA